MLAWRTSRSPCRPPDAPCSRIGLGRLTMKRAFVSGLLKPLPSYGLLTVAALRVASTTAPDLMMRPCTPRGDGLGERLRLAELSIVCRNRHRGGPDIPAIERNVAKAPANQPLGEAQRIRRIRTSVKFSVNIRGARGERRTSIGIGGSSVRYFFGRPKDVEFTAFRAMAPTKERDVSLTGDFWRRGSEFLPFPRILRLTKRRARPFARLLPPPRRDLPARRRSSVTVSASVTPTSIMSLRALEFSYAALGCAEASSSVSWRVVQLKPPPRSWEY